MANRPLFENLLPDSEPLMRRVSEKAGMHVNRTEISTFGKTKALMIERFDLRKTLEGRARNFSILLGPLGRFRLTPLYDVQPNHSKLHQTVVAFLIRPARGRFFKNL